MIRDTFFSLHRFVNVCRKEMVENWKTYILRSVMVYGMLAIVFVWNGYYQYHNLEAGAVGMDPIWEFESRFFLWGLVIWGCISASFAMERMKSKTSRTVVLMTPATMFEKFFARWLVATCGFILVFLIAFKLADLQESSSIFWPTRSCMSFTPFRCGNSAVTRTVSMRR